MSSFEKIENKFKEFKRKAAESSQRRGKTRVLQEECEKSLMDTLLATYKDWRAKPNADLETSYAFAVSSLEGVSFPLEGRCIKEALMLPPFR